MEKIYIQYDSTTTVDTPKEYTKVSLLTSPEFACKLEKKRNLQIINFFLYVQVGDDGMHSWSQLKTSSGERSDDCIACS